MMEYYVVKMSKTALLYQHDKILETKLTEKANYSMICAIYVGFKDPI